MISRDTDFLFSGFAVEGIKREALWFEGKAVDTIWMGILKKEYEERYGVS